MVNRMLGLGLTIVGSVFLIGSAQAADLPVRPVAPHYVAPAPVWSWTGFYIGGHGGAGWGTEQANLDISSLGAGGVTGTFPVADVGTNGFLGGVQAGYNWQWNSVVFGIEGDFTGGDINGTSPCLVGFLNCTAKTNWIGDITGRLGLANDRMLIYIKGGWAWAHTDYDASLAIGPLSIAGSASATHDGGLIGAGVEYAFTPNWTAKVEYNYMDLGTNNITFPITAGGGAGITPTINVDERIHLIKVGVNYKF
jgi:outer membrane immunogenic protein